MKLDTARLLADVRHTCQTIDKSVPRWVLVLFVASLGALLLVELDRRFQINERESHILLPIGVAALDDDGDNVFVPALNAESVLNYPPYAEIQITREYEEAMLRALSLETGSGDQFYERDCYDASGFYRRGQ